VKTVILIALLLSTYSTATYAFKIDEKLEAKIKALSGKLYWHRLMHYRTGIRGFRSQADGDDFFFSKDGRVDAFKEMMASVEVLDQNIEVGRLKTHPQCAFPERSRYLMKELDLPIAKKSCPEYEQWIKAINAQSASLVFSSYYAGNPASIFGHTFLKLNSVPLEELKDSDGRISDYGISFAASADMNGGLMFAIYGLTGGYWGDFSLKPYYEKLNEYTKSESRDLWEYHLDLKKDELTRMMGHFWELGYNNRFKYFFIDENCAYQLLTLIEIAKPEWDLTSGFPFYVLPADTIKVFDRYPGSVVNVTYRPSLQKLLDKRRVALKDDEKEIFYNLVNGKIQPKDTQDREALETYISFLRYKTFASKTGGVKVFKDSLRNALVSRAILGGVADYKEKKLFHKYSEPRPDKSHNGYSAWLFQGNNNKLDNFTELRLRSGLHDLLNDDRGYPRNSQIEFLSGRFRYNYTDKNFRIEEIQIFGATSLTPVDKAIMSISWSTGLLATEPKDKSCDKCLSPQFFAGGGMNFEFFDKRFSLYGLLEGKLEYGDKLNRSFRYGPQINAGSIIKISEPLKIHLSEKAFLNVNTNKNLKPIYSTTLGSSYSFGQSYEARMMLTHVIPDNHSDKTYREGKLGVIYHF